MAGDEDRADVRLPKATGVEAALIVDLLLGLGVKDPLALRPDEQRRLIEDAVADGRIDDARVSALRELGILRSD